MGFTQSKVKIIIRGYKNAKLKGLLMSSLENGLSYDCEKF